MPCTVCCAWPSVGRSHRLSGQGGVVLVPIYAQGLQDSTGATKLSLANVEDDARAMWAPIVFAWFFTLYFLYSMQKEILA